MKIRKWLMKQEWRIVKIRGIWSLFYGILLLAAAYYSYIPIFSNLGALGPFLFAIVIVTVFLILGYIYDRILLMWAPSREVTMERNPYQYVPSPKEHIFWFPLYSSILDGLEELAKANKVDLDPIHDTKEYYSRIQQLRPERKEDLDLAIKLRDKYISNHPYYDTKEDQ